MNTLLHCEDSLADMVLMKEALKATMRNINYVHVKNGEEGINYIKDATTMPKLVLLDLNMPKSDGFDFLAQRNAHEEWKKIPVVIFTSSDAPKDIKKSYALYANAYVQKVFEFSDLKELVDTTIQFWMECNKLG